MSLAATCWAWEKNLPADEKLLLVALADCHDPDRNRCIFSINRMSSMTGMDDAMVLFCLETLAEDGLIGAITGYNSELSEVSMVI